MKTAVNSDGLNPTSALVIVKQTFKAMAEASGDERLLATLDPSNPGYDGIINSDSCHRETLRQVLLLLEERGIVATLVDRLPGEQFEVNEDLVITVGGDGTFLDASHSIKTKVPVLGVNSAPVTSFGNFCPVDKDSVAQYLDAILDGTIKPVQLKRLRVAVDGEVLPTRVLNEVFISHSSPAGTTRYRFSVNDMQTMQKSSGLIISTASGSTGINRSAGGHVLKITSGKLSYTNLAPFIEPGKPFFDRGKLPQKEAVTIQSEMADGLLFLDGQHICYEIDRGSIITIDNKAPAIFAFVDKKRHLAFKAA